MKNKFKIRFADRSNLTSIIGSDKYIPNSRKESQGHWQDYQYHLSKGVQVLIQERILYN